VPRFFPCEQRDEAEHVLEAIVGSGFFFEWMALVVSWV